MARRNKQHGTDAAAQPERPVPQTSAHVDFELDLCGESCPYPVVHTLDALAQLRAGERLAVTTDCPQSFRNIPERTVAKGHLLVGEPTRSGPQMTFVIERGRNQQ